MDEIKDLVANQSVSFFSGGFFNWDEAIQISDTINRDLNALVGKDVFPLYDLGGYSGDTSGELANLSDNIHVAANLYFNGTTLGVVDYETAAAFSGGKIPYIEYGKGDTLANLNSSVSLLSSNNGIGQTNGCICPILPLTDCWSKCNAEQAKRDAMAKQAIDVFIAKMKEKGINVTCNMITSNKTCMKEKR